MNQLDDLREALDALQERIEGLVVVVNPTGEFENTAQGRMPTVRYEITLGGRQLHSQHPFPIVIAPSTLAQEIRTLLGGLKGPEEEMLIQNIENCFVT